ncbi:putative F-box protein At3g25750 [Zingiber officinale]|uniref:putative F-box protein At3g25750 n=1 Tax=Zingiber officinale TaxID=94328 RepID=UPI001C4CAD27|nr:putative F-box protein At3g25750 [Zingiber officinale]
MASRRRNWAGLPTDLLSKIFQCFNFFHRAPFAAVCRTWRTAKGLDSSRLLPNPWLMLDMSNSTKRCLVALSSTDSDPDPTAILPLRDISGLIAIGSSPDGWLVFIDHQNEILVLNPLNKVRIQFPSLGTHPGTFSDDIRRALSEPRRQIQFRPKFPKPQDINSFSLFKVVLSPSSSAESSIAAVIYQDFGLLMISLSNGWAPLEFGIFIRDVIFYNGFLYAVDIDWTIKFWDINRQPPVLLEAIKPKYQDPVEEVHPRLFLVDCAGELMVVWRRNWSDQERPQLFKIFKLEMEENFKPLPKGRRGRYARWIQIHQLGDYSLFLGVNESRALSCQEFPNLKKNSIYFTNDPQDVMDRELRIDVGVYDIEEEEEATVIPATLQDDDFEEDFKWPVWFFPSYP